jgi:hypothetical protein
MCSLLRLDDRALNGVKGSKSSMISMVVKESAIFFGSCAAPVFIRIRGGETTYIGTLDVVKHDSSACVLLVRQIRAVCTDRACSAVLTCAPGRSALVAAI